MDYTILPLLVTLKTVGEGREVVAIELEQFGNIYHLYHQHRYQRQSH